MYRVFKRKDGTFAYRAQAIAPDIKEAYPDLAKRLTPKVYVEMMKIFGDEILKKLKKEMTRLMGLKVIPVSKNLKESFEYEIDGATGALKFYTKWDKASYYISGSKSYKMYALTRQRGFNKKIPMKNKNGEVVFRSVPLRTDKAWVHPGIQKFSFFEKAAELGRWAAAPKAIDLLRKRGLL